MLSYLRAAFVLLFVAFPLIEIAVLIKVGETIGFWPTMTLLVAAAILGMIVIRKQGLSMVGRMLDAMREGRMPLEPMLDGYIVIMAGLLLIIPGLISDVVGLLLLVPPLRRWGMRRVVPGLFGAPPIVRTTRPGTLSRPTIIEGTFERRDPGADEPPRDP